MVSEDAIQEAVAEERKNTQPLMEDLLELLNTIQRDEQTVAAGLWQGGMIDRLRRRIREYLADGPGSQ